MNSVQQSPYRGADSLPACQEICRSFWNPKVRYRVHKSPLLVIQRQLNPVHSILVHEEQFIHLRAPVFYEWSLFLTFPNQPLSTMRIAFAAYLILSDLMTHAFSEHYLLQSSLLHSLLHSSVALSPLGPNIFLSTRFWNTLSLSSPLIAKDPAAHPYKTKQQTPMNF
jgi:hypothetical protein